MKIIVLWRVELAIAARPQGRHWARAAGTVQGRQTDQVAPTRRAEPITPTTTADTPPWEEQIKKRPDSDLTGHRHALYSHVNCTTRSVVFGDR